ncbi:MAG: AmmeMemoRadiSam system protein A [bacterium]|nr:AmmeMemoRadiSam system protein A [bacterium]
MGEKDKEFLLNLARQSIKYFLENNEILKIDENGLSSPALKEKRATFVTLTINENLRGCIGRLKAIKPLYQDVIENAINSAFYDGRFKPLAPEEFLKIKIEISVLTPPQEITYRTAEELLQKLEPPRHGVIIEKDFHLATYLPQVWIELPSKEEFLTSLCLKAGLSANEWKNNTLLVKIYEVESFEEKNNLK